MKPEIREELKVYRSKIDSSGRILLPAELRSRHGLDCGDAVVLVDNGTAVEMKSNAEAIREAQHLFKRSVPRDRLLSGELLRDRRNEAERE